MHDGLAGDGDIDTQDIAHDAEPEEKADNPPASAGGPWTGGGLVGR